MATFNTSIPKGSVRFEAAQDTSETPTLRLRIRRGIPGTLMPPNLGIEQAWECRTGYDVRIEWRPLECVPSDAPDHE